MSTTVTDQTPPPTADAHAATCARAALLTAAAGRQEPYGDLVEVEELPDGRPPSGSEHLILRQRPRAGIREDFGPLLPDG